MTELEKLENVKDIQCSAGNFDQNEYMRGMANGLILAVHIMKDVDGTPPYKEFVEDTDDKGG